MGETSERAFAGQVALVTGASSGVGRCVSLALAAQGATVVLVGRNEGRLQAAKAEADARGGVGVIQRGDLTRDDDLEKIAERVTADFGSLNLLVHAAGVIATGATDDSPLSELDRQYSTNLRAPYALTKLVLPLLRDSRGQVVFINSTQGSQAAPENGQYAASKHGLRAVADSLRREVNEDGVRVLTVILGRTATPMQEELHEAEGRAYRAKELIQPDDVADMVLGALVVPESSQVTEMTMLPTQPPGRVETFVAANPIVFAFSGLLAGAV